MVAEKNRLLKECENNYKQIQAETKARHEREKTELFHDNLKKMSDLQELYKRKIDSLENQLQTVKKNYSRDFEKWNKESTEREDEIKSYIKENNHLARSLSEAYDEIQRLKTEKIELTKDFIQDLDTKNQMLMEKEQEMTKKFEAEKKIALAKVYNEKMDMETKYEKTMHMLHERCDALAMKYRMLETKKKDMFLKENQITMQRIVNEMNEKNKNIDQLNREIARLKVQVKYAGETMKLFASDKIASATHKKSGSESANSAVTKQRPSSGSVNKSFKF